MDRAKIAAGVRLILDGIGEAALQSDLRKTPERVAEMFTDILSGYALDEEMNGSFSESTAGDNLIHVNNIPFYSICEHHLLPFFGKVSITYLPNEGRIAGFSDFNRIVDVFARRLQIQERMTGQIAEAVQKSLQPVGIHVSVSAMQLCAAMRGQHAKPIRAITECRIGNMPEFLPRRR